jgi:glycosyltransferase involved in cell wall biosynthesis
VRVAFVYPNPRGDLARAWRRGEAPDSPLLGQNHLHEHGIDAYVHDPGLARAGDGRLNRHLREVALPLELRGADVAVTPLHRVFPTLARIAGPRTVVFNYGFNVMLRSDDAVRRHATRMLLRAPTRIVCLSDAQRTTFLELTGLPPARVATVRLGTDTQFFSPLEAPVDDRLVISVGRDMQRDYPTLIAALGDVENARVELACHPRNVAGLALPPSFGAQTYDHRELRALYARAACVVIPQYPETHTTGTEAGGTTALLEAMAMGKAIVVNDRANLLEYVGDGETALVVPTGDAQALRAATLRLLEDAALRNRLGAAARAAAVERYTTRRMAADLAPLIEAAAA